MKNNETPQQEPDSQEEVDQALNQIRGKWLDYCKCEGDLLSVIALLSKTRDMLLEIVSEEKEINL